jgi:tetratricopeptide (TPR) repeat protein
VPPSPAESAAGEDDADSLLREVLALTDQADDLLQAGRIDEAVQTARRAKNLDLNLERTWRVFARGLEAQGEFAVASVAYKYAVDAGADQREIRPGMARVALRLGDYAKAENLLTIHHEAAAATVETIADLAQAQTLLMAFDRAHATLKTALEADPGQALLWLTLAQLLCVQGRHAQAVVFFEESLRLDPDSALAQSGLADALLLGGGDVERALSVSAAALAAAALKIVPAMTDAHARRQLAVGRLTEGWDALARGMEPGDAALVEVRMAAPLWRPGMQLDGRLLLIGEDSVMDELLLAQVVHSISANGPPLILAFDPRWGALARRSFPTAAVVPLLSRTQDGRRLKAAELEGSHTQGGELVAAWAPLRSQMRAHRGRITDFADAPGYLKTDLKRVCYWRKRLDALGPGPKVGVIWGEREDARAWEAPPLRCLAEPLSVPDIHLISLEQEDAPGELERVQAIFGLRIHRQPIDLRREDLDDLAALAQALDVVVGPPDTVTFLAAACGARTWFLSTPHHWAMLGSGSFPWFPRARVISAAAADDWTEAMAELGHALATLAAEPPPA